MANPVRPTPAVVIAGAASVSAEAAADNKLARTVLIELLAHQFCMPVQWIDTQDLILGACGTKRIIELGPGSTLANMARRTVALKYQTRDLAGGIDRQFLDFDQRLDDISYNFGSLEVASPPPPVAATAPAPAPAIVSAPAVVEAARSDPTPSTSTNSATQESSNELPDARPTAQDMLHAIVSVCLKKPLTASHTVQSIKALCMGRSTLQNETIGDLASEFDHLPDNAEDMALEDLAEILQRSSTGKLGKKTTSLIERLHSLKLPHGFRGNIVRGHLQSRWCLQPGRQDVIFLQAVQEQPDVRLNEDEARTFFDELAQRYMTRNGLQVPSKSVHVSQDSQVMSSEAFRTLESRQQAMWRSQLMLYSNLLGLDTDQSQSIVNDLQRRVVELERELNSWVREHGEVYASGIEPIFSPSKARVYDSWRNWALEDVLQLITCQTESSTHEQHRLRKSIVNRSHPRLVSALRFQASRAENAAIFPTLRDLLAECECIMYEDATVLPLAPLMMPTTTVDEQGSIACSVTPRHAETDAPKLRLGRKTMTGVSYLDHLTARLHASIVEVQTCRFSLSGKTVLITGAGQGSIGHELVAQMLSAGAQVIVTTSSYSRHTAQQFQEIYAGFGGKGSRLILLPFNQASNTDIIALIKYIYDDKHGLGLDLDIVVPFAALSENGRPLEGIDSKSELAHRLMFTNCLRLLGTIKQHKADGGILTRPAQVILPLSPNHGSFGNDGLYAGSKLGLESLFEKFHSEDWTDYLLICGVSIGWTRGTKLTTDMDIVAAGMEKLGIRTFDAGEMASNILGLTSLAIVSLCVDEPLIADFTGGMADFEDIKAATTRIRTEIMELSEERKAIAAEQSHDNIPSSSDPSRDAIVDPEPEFPQLPSWETDIEPLTEHLQGMLDLDRVVVVAGFSEVGPWGSARVRWDMEIHGHLSVASCIELAWCMGLIEAHSQVQQDGDVFSGWLDVATREPIADAQVRAKYESYVLEHAGMRYMEPTSTSPHWDARESLYEIEISKELEPFEVSRDIAIQLKLAHGDHATISPVAGDDGHSMVKLRHGAKIRIPKLIQTPHTVAGQLPKGWSAKKYGVPDDIVEQVDPATLYGLVSSAEVLHSAGLANAYELYEHVHVGDVANCVGSGVGGVSSFQKVFKGRYRDDDIAKDVLAESFISSGSAWINMLLLSASGANKTPVGACATATESLDTACELIQSGKSKVCLVGSFEDTLKDVSDEFANLGATVNPELEATKGREPGEMSRPATSTRAGFVEAEGAGMQLVMSAKVALDMGLPIYGIIALTMTAMDKAGRSIPAPGRGLLGAARQKSPGYDSPLMNPNYRRRLLNARLQQTDDLHNLELEYLRQELDDFQGDIQTKMEYEKGRLAEIEQNMQRDRSDARWQFGNRFWAHDDSIAPLRGALGAWGLTIDDIDVVSFHGTSTMANEKNEIGLVNQQLAHLGRKEGNLIPGVFQKSLTGHPKGPAGAWMLNGCLQMLRDGIIPGISTADNIDAELEKDGYIVFPRKSLFSPNLRAFALQLFGFGQKGAMAIGIHARFLFATLTRDDYDAYTTRARQRQRHATRRFHNAMFGGAFFQAKSEPPYTTKEEMAALLDPDFRVKAVR